jgi:hypothetical protein
MNLQTKRLLGILGLAAASVLFFVGYGQKKQGIDWSAQKITIRTEAELRELATIVNSGERHFNGQTIVLANNIKLDREKDWVSIGIRGVKPFNGTFDGNGKTIIGNNCIASLFGCTLNGEIKNLNVAGMGKTMRFGRFAVIINPQGATVHSSIEPYADTDENRKVDNGDSLEILGMEGRLWVKVRTENGDGYVSVADVEIVEVDCGQIADKTT